MFGPLLIREQVGSERHINRGFVMRAGTAIGRSVTVSPQPNQYFAQLHHMKLVGYSRTYRRDLGCGEQ
jgi:hypothetical protein